MTVYRFAQYAECATAISPFVPGCGSRACRSPYRRGPRRRSGPWWICPLRGGRGSARGWRSALGLQVVSQGPDLRCDIAHERPRQATKPGFFLASDESSLPSQYPANGLQASLKTREISTRKELNGPAVEAAAANFQLAVA